MIRYRSFFKEEETKKTDGVSTRNEIQQLTTRLSGFQKELNSTKTPELRDEIEQKIYYIQHHIYDLEDQLEDLKGEEE